MTGVYHINLEKPLTSAPESVCCIGYFDGVHLGHQALIAKTDQMAGKMHAESALITFDPDPWVTIKGTKDSALEHITTLEQKIELAREYGIAIIYILDFTKEMCSLSPEDFVTKALHQIPLKGIVCGYDFHYGARGAGNGESLKKEAGCPVEIVREIQDADGKISSTRITRLIKSGDITTAAVLLGHPFEMRGTVIHGKRIGRTMGFPTANIHVPSEYVLPRTGVYACYMIAEGKEYAAMVNLGHNPTINFTSQLSLEANLLNFEGDLYGQNVALRFIHRIRDEKKFGSKEELITQLRHDQDEVRKMLL
ncbi:MAG: bifunctional riboflavin kinase/FAD synthetase [Bulleidia sp.]|nr:bifunctional riboflavin kinase/FAD synthetase [Bulleidia sp.]